jgi:hypothetical protein
LKTQAILQHRSKKEQSVCRSAAHLSKGMLGPAATFALVRAVNIRVIFDESRASHFVSSGPLADIGQHRLVEASCTTTNSISILSPRQARICRALRGHLFVIQCGLEDVRTLLVKLPWEKKPRDLKCV